MPKEYKRACYSMRWRKDYKTNRLCRRSVVELKAKEILLRDNITALQGSIDHWIAIYKMEPGSLVGRILYPTIAFRRKLLTEVVKILNE